MSKPEPTILKSESDEAQTETNHHDAEPGFGWNPYAEVINGRVAMLAIVSLLMLEWFTKQDLLTWLGLR